MIRMPTDDRILSIPLARCGEFDLLLVWRIK